MSTNHPQRVFEFWEYVHCAVCYLPFIIDPISAPTAPPNTPFWLTECGHTLCNSHLKPDQSCAACGAAAIRLIPLHKEMSPPMSEWFRPTSHALDALASAANFQQETMASLLNYYKRKCNQYRAIAKRVNEVEATNKTMRSQIEQLQGKLSELTGENCAEPNQETHTRSPDGQQRSRGAHSSVEPGHSLNANGKRPLISIQNEQQTHRSSSPRSVVTPAGPPRLTLPPDRQHISFPSEVGSLVQSHGRLPSGRPVSKRLDQYTYQPPMTPIRPMPLRHHQQTHVPRSEQQSHEQMNQTVMQGYVNQQQPHPYRRNPSMPPPPPPVAMQGNTNQPRRDIQDPESGHFRPATRTTGRISAPISSGGLYPQCGPAMPHKTQIPQPRASYVLTPQNTVIGRPQSVHQTPNRFFTPAPSAPLRAPLPPATAARRNARTPFVPGPGS